MLPITLTVGASAALAERGIRVRPGNAKLGLRIAVEVVDAAVPNGAGTGVALGEGVGQSGGEGQEGGEDEDFHIVGSMRRRRRR